MPQLKNKNANKPKWFINELQALIYGRNACWGKRRYYEKYKNLKCEISFTMNKREISFLA